MSLPTTPSPSVPPTISDHPAETPISKRKQPVPTEELAPTAVVNSTISQRSEDDLIPYDPYQNQTADSSLILELAKCKAPDAGTQLPSKNFAKLLPSEEQVAEDFSATTAKTSYHADSKIFSSIRVPPSWEPMIQKLPEGEQEQFWKVLNQMNSTWKFMEPSDATTKTTTSNLLEGLIKTAQEKREEWENKKWKVGGKQIVPRAVMEKIIDFAKRFREIGNIVCQYDPVHAALPWAGIVLILQVALHLGYHKAWANAIITKSLQLPIASFLVKLF